MTRSNAKNLPQTLMTLHYLKTSHFKAAMTAADEQEMSARLDVLRRAKARTLAALPLAEQKIFASMEAKFSKMQERMSLGLTSEQRRAKNLDAFLRVVDRDSVKDAAASNPPQFAKVNQLATAVWSQGGKIYFLGTTGDEEAIRKLL